MPGFLLTMTLILAAGDAGGSRPPVAPRPAIGSLVADFAIEDNGGKTHHLHDWASSRFVCVVFLRPGCPVAELDTPTLADLIERFRLQPVVFLGVAPAGAADQAELARFASDHRLGMPMFVDPGPVADQLGATRTPEAVVLDAERRIRYRGRIDDRHSIGASLSRPVHEDLADALDDLLAGRDVRRPETTAVGCPIAGPAPVPSPEPKPTDPTYCRDVAPILDRSCVPCHRPGQIGPFALTDYRETVRRAGAIAEAVAAERMPPWHANPLHGKFANDVRLPDRDKDQLLGWIENGCPEGDTADLAPPTPRPTGWRIARPDLVVTMPVSFPVPARGVIDYQYFEVDPGFTTDRWIQAAEIRPGNRRVVHHASVFLKPPTPGRQPEAQGELGSYCLATTTPGTPPLTLPSGMAKRVPAGWRFLFVVHYAPVGTEQVDRTSLGLIFADPASVRQEVATNLLLAPDLRILAHDADHVVERSRRFDADVLLLAMFPHMHLRGKSFRYEVILPDGQTETLLDVPHFDFAWQNRYELAQPRRLPAGTTIRCVARYDNSAANPNNPDPTATVRAGPQSWDEMFNGYYDIALADQDLTRPPGCLQAMLPNLKRMAGPMAIIVGGVGLALLTCRIRNRDRANPEVKTLTVDAPRL